METIFASLISAAAAIIVCVITQILQARKTEALITYRLSELEKKVDKHNNLVERTYRLEQAVNLQEERVSVANHRIRDLEEKVS